MLAGSTALVTGASRGIGRAIAVALASRGADLVVTSRRGPDLEEVARATAGRAIAADLVRSGEVERLIERVRTRLGGAPTVLVNAAGRFQLVPAARLEPEELERHLAVNLRAPILLARAFLPEMLSRGRGHLVHIGSVAGRWPFRENAAYAASKYGLRGFHEVLRLELEGTGVRTSLIEPGPVDTPAWDAVAERLGADLPSRSRMLRPERVAEAVITCLALGREGAEADLRLVPE